MPWLRNSWPPTWGRPSWIGIRLGATSWRSTNSRRPARLVQDALDQQDPDLVNKWTKAQKSYFEQARACANDMGMTITSRCRLVLPDRKDKEENPFLKMMEERRRA